MEEKKNIGSLFDRIAGSYDLLNHLLSFNIDKYWRRKAVKKIARKEQALQCLDVAIGTADLSLEMLRQIPDIEITGIDLSTEMMKIGEEKVKKVGKQDNVHFLEANAQQMPFEDNSFDVVTCSYGVRNFADLDQGLSEMYRVLKPNGQLMILEFSYPENKLVAWVYDLYFTHILPFVGRLISKDKTAYTYLNRSVKNFIWGETMCEHLRQAGFGRVEFQTMTFGITSIYISIK